MSIYSDWVHRVLTPPPPPASGPLLNHLHPRVWSIQLAKVTCASTSRNRNCTETSMHHFHLYLPSSYVIHCRQIPSLVNMGRSIYLCYVSEPPHFHFPFTSAHFEVQWERKELNEENVHLKNYHHEGKIFKLFKTSKDGKYRIITIVFEEHSSGSAAWDIIKDFVIHTLKWIVLTWDRWCPQILRVLRKIVS